MLGELPAPVLDPGVSAPMLWGALLCGALLWGADDVVALVAGRLAAALGAFDAPPPPHAATSTLIAANSVKGLIRLFMLLLNRNERAFG